VSRSEADVLAAIEERRRRPHRKLLDEQITLSHGAGGRSSHTLVETVFAAAFANDLLAPLADAAIVGLPGARLAFTTDAFVVRPLEFPGGDIGDLAVNGTVNDLAMAGAQPLALSAAFVLEEGLDTVLLQRIVASMARAASVAGVAVATGDTKVVERGKADGLYVCTTGIGIVPDDVELGTSRIVPGDRVLVSGTLGDHGMAVMAARGDLAIELELDSDTAALHGLADRLLEAGGAGVRCLRDPTRGGLATVLNELALGAEAGMVLHEAALPVRRQTLGACELLGIDPLYVANEGKLVAVVAAAAAEDVLAAAQAHELGRDAAIVGEVTAAHPGMVVLETAFGGTRIVDMLAGDPLPRIC